MLIVFGGVCLHGFAAIGLSNSHEMAYRQSLTPDAFQARTNTTMRSMNRAVTFALTAIGLWFSPFRTVRIPV